MEDRRAKVIERYLTILELGIELETSTEEERVKNLTSSILPKIAQKDQFQQYQLPMYLTNLLQSGDMADTS